MEMPEKRMKCKALGETLKSDGWRPVFGCNPQTKATIFPERHRPLPKSTAQEKKNSPP